MSSDHYQPPSAPVSVSYATGDFSRHANPWLFLILMIPFGAVSGYASVTLGSQLGRAGVSVEKIAALGALSTLPHTFKFFWSPVVDVTLSAKKWYIISALLTAVGLASLGFFPATETGLAAFGFAVFLGSLASTVVGMAVESLMAHCAAEQTKGRAGGFAMAGNLGGSSIGGGLGLFMVERVPQPWMASCFVALLCVLCIAALAGMPSPARDLVGHKVFPLIGESLKDLWRTIRQRRGFAALILCFLPLGIGASSGLWSALAPEWNASPDLVAVVTGVLGGLVSIAGCIAGGYICDRRDRQTSYVWFGILVAICGVALAALPRTPAMFTVCTLVFSFVVGLSWAAYSAFVLEAIGKGAAATKFSAFSSLANAPIAYMALFNGFIHSRMGTSGMLYMEAAAGALGAVVFISVVKLLLRRRPSEPLPAASALVAAVTELAGPEVEVTEIAVAEVEVRETVDSPTAK